MDESLRIQRLRLRHAQSGAAGLAVGRLLATADLRPPGVSPQAVLVVRRLVDPQPGRLAPGLRAARVHAAWERAAQQQLAALYAQAARPALGPVSPDAPAVRFADESELLACLARDVSRGRAGDRWWWRALLRPAELSRAAQAASLVQRLIQQAHRAPAVLAQLHAWGEAAAVLRLLTPMQARGLRQAMLQAYGLSPAPDDPARSPAALAADLGREHAALLCAALELGAGDRGALGKPPRLAGGEAEAPSGFGKPAGPGGHVGGLGSFRKAPRPGDDTAKRGGLGKSPRPGGETAAFGAFGRPTRSGGDAGDLGGFGQAPRPGAATAGRGSAGKPPRPGGAPAELSGFGQPSPSGGAAAELGGFGQPSPSGGAAAELGGFGQPLRHGGKTAELGRPGKPAWPGVDAADADPGGLRQPPQPGGAAADPDGLTKLPRSGGHGAAGDLGGSSKLPGLDGDGVATRLGGVLYLINLMVALDLPACFEAGWRLDSGVGPWGLLHALGQELLPATAQAPADPLWSALARLDGRTPDQGPGCRLPRSRPRRWPAFVLPPLWAHRVPDTAASLAATAGAGRRRAADAALCTRYPPLLARWLVLALPVLDQRLRLALGLSAADSLAEHLLALPGQLYVTRTHVDLVASLADISLPARLAGLDRNPGWLPRFGRVVTLHFV